jgi:TetR/AcrR family transcriptional regulator, transcriptional repressor for nem operon
VGRKREYDYGRVLARATSLFWAKGFTDASMRDILKTTGIKQGSFYHLFGGKKRLYLECMKHYNDTVGRQRLGALQADASARKGVRGLFRFLLEELDNPKTPRVCLMSRSLSSDVLSDSEMAAYVKMSLALFDQLLIARFNAAKESKELPPDFQAEIVAQIISTYLQGFFRVMQVVKDREQMWRQMDGFLTRLGL